MSASGACAGASARTRRAALLSLVLAVVAAAASAGPAGASVRAARARVDVVVAFYPLAFAAEEVGGRRVAVHDLTPPGTEPHDLELSTDQRDRIEDADVVLVMGGGFQPAVEKAADARDGRTVRVLDRLDLADRDDPDPHVWLDPAVMQAIVDEVARALTRADPKGRAKYRANAERLHARLTALDERYRQGLAECERRLLVTAHDAFGHLARAYDLDHAAVTGLSPEVEPDPKRLARLADLARREDVTTIFTEELLPRRLAETLAREAGGLRTDTISALEGLSPRERRNGDDYVTVMDRNLERIRRALGCA